ncbi:MULTISPECIES: 2-C-methyl-D-erythritol 2,4-cyclodiphosphate synthase [unclassified Thermotoga]|uniref:2-C-methyl-D-erythritol 2,4-cyclodiphosphate synthase n=1 Tax=unclassified Thermotoga TaxID=2631113 RepID=UPI000280E727|nr:MULTISPECIES: 2-C-methyl-D-erythritol 2,4-cyclodiphosphate synthase [unclassified Thermotoga]AIY85835.1 2-C-methyl-D-erythritol 2,4-cyclodiphosphate synthase [Thermotoga sp. 2812B]EJX26878.1 2-C-methyl-D-erythritol 2,4-cyclodiphosphate synthase [Thermotoga sp. EMP]
MFIGFGYDRHPLVGGRKLVLAGVEIESSVGSLGHSDGDVLSHAIIDALLGAVGLGDIGTWFPETEEYRNANSLELLKETVKMLEEKGFSVVNVDATVVTSIVKLFPYRERIVENLKSALKTSRVNVKFKSGNTLGFEGEGRGISAYAVCLVEKKKCTKST